MATVTHMTYTRVAHDAGIAAMVDRTHDAGVDAFLLDHVDALRSLASSGDAPAATFVDPEAEQLFQQLVDGNDQEFLDAAGTLAKRLVGRMDKRAAPGLLVCLRAEHEGVVSGAALKLEVVTEHAAVLEALDSGEEILSAATNVLDAPGELQKGALVADPRPDSAVVIGDRLAKDAQYFPAAFGIRTEQRAADAAAELVAAIQPHLAQAAREAARELPSVPAGELPDVLAGLAERVPALTPEIIDQVSTTLAERARPVRRVDTAAPMKEQLQADGITVTGTPAAMRAATVEPDPQGGYRITIRVRERPRISYRR